MEAALAGAVLSSVGFQTIRRNNIMQLLNRVSPDGQTAFRDATVAGIILILKLNNGLAQLGRINNNWNFLHIVITDGQDNSSNKSLEEAGSVLMQVGMLIPNSRCKTIFIGVDLNDNQQALREIQVLNAVGGDTTSAYHVNNIQLNDIFDRIRMDLGVQRNINLTHINRGGNSATIAQVTNRPVLNITRQQYAVVFNLDISGSMQGNRWNTVKSCVSRFVNNMHEDDLVSCLTFNNKVNLLTK